MPVVHCPRDDQGAEFYAADFIHAAFRGVLDFALYGFGEDEVVDRRYLARWSRELGPLLPPPCAAVLSRLVTTPTRNAPDSPTHYEELMTKAEYDRIVARDLSFKRLGDQIVWMEE